MKTPIVTIVGRPNVGKSTLFNKIAGSRIAIEDKTAGTTRDRIFYKVETREIDFFLVDTGGLHFEKAESTIEDDMRAQVDVALHESDLILFVVSAKDQLTGDDFKLTEMLRRKGNNTPVFLVINKCDHPLDSSQRAEFYSLGLDEPIEISAMHKTGIEMMVDRIVKQFRSASFLTKGSAAYKKVQKFDESHANVALVGRPNVGKSSLINALVNKEKLIVSEIPGTTRDSTDTLIRHQGKDYNFIDTAGLRRRGKITKGIEKYSALRSLTAISRCDTAILVIDGSESISHQDQAIANSILSANKGLILLVNKWDIKGEEEEKEEKRRIKKLHELQRKFQFLSWAPVVFTSAVTKKNFPRIFEQIDAIKEEQEKRITTGRLNDFLSQMISAHKPTGAARIKPKILYITQVETKPPYFIIFVNKKSSFHFSYIRHIENRLREKFGFNGTPLKLEYRERN